MGRKIREWYPGAVYHVVTRGNRKEDIFLSKEDYRQYMSYLNLVCKKHPFKLYSYCLMGNHVHLQMATIDCEIWRIMRGVNWLYSMYFNEKYGLVGHLFQDRYFAELIKTESYLLQTSRYIHLNPVKAGFVDKPLKYLWSSYGVYMGLRRDALVSEEIILGCMFNGSRVLYKEYVECEDEEGGNKTGTVDIV
ncbi:MAG: transposase [Clostridiales bacterium]|nr:transposase [Clostridiales bacterium]